MIVLALLILIINVIYINHVLIYNTVYRQDALFWDFAAEDGEIGFLIVGDSHAVVDVNPEFIPNSWNLATNGEKYGKSYFKLKRILESGVKIKYVLLELDMHTFLTNFDADPNWQNDLYMVKEFVPYIDLRRIYDLNSTNFFFVEMYFPFFGHTDEFLYLFKKPDLEILHKGWIRDERNFSAKDMKEATYQKYLSVYVNQSRISDISFPYFIRTLRLLEKHDVKAIFITYPVSSFYADVLEENGVVKEDHYGFIFSKINEIVDEYHYLDYYSLYFDHPDYFSDPDHLHWQGAAIFSKKLNADLLLLDKVSESE
ncbi:hypothetical protein GOV09_00875 [Candidatus Woesearchaeota archaeon]|nr:hypothetical protein [Candidatus Woesearchaeota archaeon]